MGFVNAHWLFAFIHHLGTLFIPSQLAAFSPSAPVICLHFQLIYL